MTAPTSVPETNGQTPPLLAGAPPPPPDISKKRRAVIDTKKQQTEAAEDLPQVEALAVLSAINQDVDALLEGVQVARQAGVLGGRLVGVPCPLYPEDKEAGYPGLRVWYRTANRFDVARIWIATAERVNTAEPKMSDDEADAAFGEMWPLFIVRFDPPLQAEGGAKIENVSKPDTRKLLLQEDSDLALWLTSTGYETAKAATSKNS